MIVLSLFDGISCGQLALNRASIKYDKYFASEIDKHAIKVTQHNFPDTIQLGDVTKIDYVDGNLINENGDIVFSGEIDLLIGGSPCQSLSSLGNKEYLNGKSGLFFNFVDLKNKINPKYFILENVKTKNSVLDEMSNHLGSKPLRIN